MDRHGFWAEVDGGWFSEWYDTEPEARAALVCEMVLRGVPIEAYDIWREGDTLVCYVHDAWRRLAGEVA